MGFSYLSYAILLPKPIDSLLDIWANAKHIIRVAILYLGLFDHPTGFSPSWELDHMIMRPRVHHATLSAAHHLHELSSVTPELVKKALPIVEFADFVERSGSFNKDVVVVDGDDDDDIGDHQAAPICTICLSRLEGVDEMRELWNCPHVFHLGCLDRWVDQGNMTCPLCRSSLLPEEEEEEEKKRGMKDSWMVERIAYLFGEDLMSMGIDF